jgi:3-dehydroquinate dehydratase / shikimate dehydrogenase
VLLVGNGGAARGAAYALTAGGAKLSIVGRNPDRVRALAKACDAEAVSREQAEAGNYDALVHATPLGMYPHVDECFFKDRIPAELVFDMVYNPLETALIKRGREQGKQVIEGIHMFLEQAIRQFEIWSNETAPRAVMEKVALETLAGAGHHMVVETGN